MAQRRYVDLQELAASRLNPLYLRHCCHPQPCDHNSTLSQNSSQAVGLIFRRGSGSPVAWSQLSMSFGRGHSSVTYLDLDPKSAG